jgi:hypothetical protein
MTEEFWRRAALVIGGAVLAWGCAADVVDETDLEEGALIDGIPDYTHPEVGFITGGGCSGASCVGYCTATLVSSNVVLTAAHCVGFATTYSDLAVGQHGYFVIESSPGVSAGWYPISQIRSFGSTVGRDDDLALVRLRAAVPPSVATPARLAATYPSEGTTLTMWGYGCTDRGSGAGSGTKRRSSYPMGDRPDRLCPGDSGGPHLEPGGSIVRVNSGYETRVFGAWHADLYAQVPLHYSALQSQVDGWAPSWCTPATARPSIAFETFGDTGGSTTILTNASSCRWDANADVPWIGLSPASGIGNETINVFVWPNYDAGARIGRVNVAGSSLPMLQAGTVRHFTDVPSSFIEPYIDVLRQSGITRGCSTSPAMYCPYDSVTRGQMATFIVRSQYGDSFPYDPTPYFEDVPPTHVFFPYIQKLAELGITRGCSVSPSLFCESEPTTRGQMAVFLTRALLGDDFAYPTTPAFNDVGGSHLFFKYIQKLHELGIAGQWDPSGWCGLGNFCSDTAMRRDLMAVWLSRAFLGAP